MFCNGEEVLVTGGTKPEYIVDVWAGNHPFYQAGDDLPLSTQKKLNRDIGQVERAPLWRLGPVSHRDALCRVLRLLSCSADGRGRAAARLRRTPVSPTSTRGLES